MGSSGGSSSYKAPTMTPPPGGMIAGQGQTAPFNPTYNNFLTGDPMKAYTGVTDAMLTPASAVAAGPGAAGGSGDRNLLAEIMAQLDAMNKPKQPTGPGRWLRGAHRNGGGRDSGGYSTSGRSGAGGLGSRSSSASRAGGGLY